MIRIFFVFVGEGSTDAALVPHLEDLCVLCGAAEATGIAPDLGRLPQKVGRAVGAQVTAAVDLEPNANLVFVHRDADSVDGAPRYQKISEALEALDVTQHGVPVVPVQETEAWLLLEEEEIRRVADNPNGKSQLDLPAPRRVEEISDPKALLAEILVKASALKGRRLERFKRSIPRRVKLLLERLDPEGKVRLLPAWQKLRSDLQAAIQSMRKP